MLLINYDVAAHLAITSWLLVIPIDAQQARIIVPPESVNVELNKTFTFTCTAIGEEIRWRVNRATITADLRSRGFDDSSALVTLNATQNLHMSTMTVFGSTDNNGTNITCVAIVFSSLSADESEAALLLVFEPDSQKVSNLTVTLINSTTVLISWSPPFTLEGVPILGYNVTITNTTSGENETTLVENTNLLYSIDHPDPENNFTVTVVPINEVGAGQPAIISLFLPLITISSPTSVIIKSQSMDVTSLFNTMTSNTLLSTAITIAQTTDTVTSPTTDPLMITPDLRAPFSRSLSAVVAVIVVAMVTMITTTIVITLSCCLLKKHKTIKAAKPPTGDVVPVSNNLAYGEIAIRSIKMKENTAYATVQPAVLPQYVNVVMKENNEFAIALTDAEDFALKENSAYAITQPAAPVAPQYDEFVMKENSAYGLTQSSVSHEHEDFVMKENTAYTTTTTTTESLTYYL